MSCIVILMSFTAIFHSIGYEWTHVHNIECCWTNMLNWFERACNYDFIHTSHQFETKMLHRYMDCEFFLNRFYDGVCVLEWI
jgi:hypothetical protein